MVVQVDVIAVGTENEIDRMSSKVGWGCFVHFTLMLFGNINPSLYTPHQSMGRVGSLDLVKQLVEKKDNYKFKTIEKVAGNNLSIFPK